GGGGGDGEGRAVVPGGVEAGGVGHALPPVAGRQGVGGLVPGGTARLGTDWQARQIRGEALGRGDREGSCRPDAAVVRPPGGVIHPGREDDGSRGLGRQNRVPGRGYGQSRGEFRGPPDLTAVGRGPDRRPVTGGPDGTAP